MDQMARAHEHYDEGVPTQIEPVSVTVDHLLKSAAADFPNKVAIEFLGREYTYSEVFDDVKRAAMALTMCGVRKGDVVAVILPNCPQHYVAFYAIASIGAICAEHNPLAPVKELDDQIERHGARVIVAWEQTIERLTESGSLKSRTYLSVNLVKALPKRSQLLLRLPVKAAKTNKAALRGKVPAGVHSWDNQVKHADRMNFDSMVGPDLDDTFVLLQTGGTTGTPKAVELSHRNVLSNTRQVDHWLKVFKRGQECVGAVLPFFHAFGLQLSLLTCTNMAATQVMTPRFDVDMLLAGHKRHPMTFFGGVPPMYERILDAIDAGKVADLTTIKFAVSGAMSLAPELASRWEEATGGFIIEGYGMSEASPVVSGSPLTPGRRPSTLGVPFPSTEIKIVDPENPEVVVPDGEIGEITVRGPQVFKGYHNAPEETANVLLEGGWLRTGDLGRWDDGFVVMADRRKELIINGGFNVYPSEVERAIREMPGISDVAVVGVPNGTRGEQVVAALVLEPGAVVDLDAVRRWTADKLSHYEMPKSIAVLEDLPRSQLGKVMRRSVKEQLASLELVSGQWRKKIGEVGEDLSSRIEELMAGIRETAGGTTEQVAAWVNENTQWADGFKTWVADKTITSEEFGARMEQIGMGVENFKEWLANKAKRDDPEADAPEAVWEVVPETDEEVAGETAAKAGAETATDDSPTDGDADAKGPAGTIG